MKAFHNPKQKYVVNNYDIYIIFLGNDKKRTLICNTLNTS